MLSSGFLFWNFLFGLMANNHNHRHGEKILFIKELFSENQERNRKVPLVCFPYSTLLKTPLPDSTLYRSYMRIIFTSHRIKKRIGGIVDE